MFGTKKLCPLSVLARCLSYRIQTYSIFHWLWQVLPICVRLNEDEVSALIELTIIHRLSDAESRVLINSNTTDLHVTKIISSG